MRAKQRRREGKIAQKLASGSLEGECRHEALQVLRQQGPRRAGSNTRRLQEQSLRGGKRSQTFLGFLHITSRKPVVF